MKNETKQATQRTVSLLETVIDGVIGHWQHDGFTIDYIGASNDDPDVFDVVMTLNTCVDKDYFTPFYQALKIDDESYAVEGEGDNWNIFDSKHNLVCEFPMSKQDATIRVYNLNSSLTCIGIGAECNTLKITNNGGLIGLDFQIEVA